MAAVSLSAPPGLKIEPETATASRARRRYAAACHAVESSLACKLEAIAHSIAALTDAVRDLVHQSSAEGHSSPHVRDSHAPVGRSGPHTLDRHPTVAHSGPPVLDRDAPVGHSGPEVLHRHAPVGHSGPHVLDSEAPVGHARPQVLDRHAPVGHSGLQVLECDAPVGCSEPKVDDCQAFVGDSAPQALNIGGTRASALQNMELDDMGDVISALERHTAALIQKLRSNINAWPPVREKSGAEGRALIATMVCGQVSTVLKENLLQNGTPLTELQLEKARAKIQHFAALELDKWERSTTTCDMAPPSLA